MTDTFVKIVLHADDDADDRDLVNDVINRLAPTYQVVAAINGKDALDKLTLLNSIGQLPCLIILDMNMPLLTGEEVLEQLRMYKSWESVPVCIFTTSPRERYAHVALKYDVMFFTKPAYPRELEKMVEEMLFLCS